MCEFAERGSIRNREETHRNREKTHWNREKTKGTVMEPLWTFFTFSVVKFVMFKLCFIPEGHAKTQEVIASTVAQ